MSASQFILFKHPIKVVCCLFFLLLANAESRASYCSFVSLNSQAQIDAYVSNHGCDSVGTLNIFSGDGLVLDSLYQLTYVSFLQINSGLDLTSFAGLHNLTHVENFTLAAPLPNGFINFPAGINVDYFSIQSSNIVDMTGLENITSLGTLFLFNLAQLSSLTGLQNLTTIETIQISNCDSLINISLPSLAQLQTLNIGQCPSLTEISGMGSVSTLNAIGISGAFGSDTLVLNQNIPNIGIINIQNSTLQSVSFPFLSSSNLIFIQNNINLTSVLFNTLDSTLLGVTIEHQEMSSFTLNFNNPPTFKTINTLNITGKIDFSVFYDLQFVESLIITNTDLTVWPFSDLISVQHLSVYFNDSLNTCCTLFNQILDNVVTGTYSVNPNGPACSGISSMYNSCGPPVDADSDGVLNSDDNCPNDNNANQADFDSDDIGDVCDNCPTVFNPGQADSNNNFIGDDCEDVNFNTKIDVDNGNVLINTSAGLILKSVDNNCYRLIIDSDGGVRTVLVSCP